MRRIISCLLALCLLAGSTAALAQTNAEMYENAIGLLKDRQYAEAAAAFTALGGYSDAARYAMYCNAIAAGEAGLYSAAVDNLKSLSGFLDSGILAVYYAGLSWEAAENYERAMEVMGGITLYRDVLTRMAGYPALINARDYRKADENEQAGLLEAALSGFQALGAYRDSADRAAAVQEKIHARDYAAADEAEQQNELEKALEGFTALGDYQDSADRAAAVRDKIAARDEAAAEQARADAYDAADQAEKDEDYAAAYAGFTALGDYRDSAERAAAVQDKGNYAQALQYAMNGRFKEAYQLFASLGDYQDSADKAYALGVTAFADVSDRKNGIAAFQFHGLWGLINININAAVSPYWDEIGQFNSFGLARVKKGSLYGYINTAGEVVVPCEWYAVSGFNDDGMCTVTKQETKTTGSGYFATTYYYYYFGLYDCTGNVITPAAWRSLGDSVNYSSGNSSWGTSRSFYGPSISIPVFSDGKTKVQDPDGKYGFIDINGQQVGEVRWDSIRDYSENLAVVVENKKSGFIDQDGQVVIQPQYADALPFSEGLAGVKTDDGFWQFIDRDNSVIIQPLYTQVNAFANGTADVFRAGTGWQVIDRTGRLVYFISAETRAAYAAAEALLADGRYMEAYDAYAALNGYADADEKMQTALRLQAEADYAAAVALRDAGQYDEARAAFAALGDFEDAASQILATWYAEGIARREAQDWERAVAAFEQAEAYNDAAEQIKETLYQQAESLRNAGEYAEAYAIYQTIADYKDVGTLLKSDQNFVAIAAREAELKAYVGSYVTFGTYPQTESGTDSTPIEWLVLEYDAKNNRALLLSRYGLDAQSYNTEYTAITWEKSSVRSWLNSTFMEKAFSTKEQSAILQTNVDNSKSQGYSGWSTSGGNNTQDKIFLLSYAEANKYFGVQHNSVEGSNNNTKSRITPTAYAKKQGAYIGNSNKTTDGSEAGWWWLRSPGGTQLSAAYVSSDGSLSRSSVTSGGGCVRPALWINLESDIF